jgi:DNA-binding NarL/FixJ family response regulator
VTYLPGFSDGLTSKEIAAELGISPRIVETHRESLMRKLDIRNMAGLIRFALESDLTET